jgi:error-prone DNA polymerase
MAMNGSTRIGISMGLLPDYTELAAASNFSFLRGASQPAALVEQAVALGHKGLGLADRNSVAGVVRAWRHLRDMREEGRGKGFRLITGARLVFADGTPDIIAYPVNRLGWGRLTRLLTTGNLRAEKGSCVLHFADLMEHADDLALIILPGRDRLHTSAEALHSPLVILRNRAPLCWLGVAMNRAGKDKRHLAEMRSLSAQTGLPLIAHNDVLYAHAADKPLHDILTCIREKVTIQKAGRLLTANAEHHLKPAAEMARLFADCPDAITETQRLMSAIHFDLGQLAYDYPHEPVPPGYTPQAWLEELSWMKAAEHWPEGVPAKVQKLLADELNIIGRMNYAAYFLTVHDVVQFAQAKGILCQGRGSAANSAVCFVLGITAVDPSRHSLLFSRFISEERREPPDIDVDFEHERREEVMQYIYKRYGRHRAGIVSTVIHYRPRSAVREVGKVLGLSEDVTARLSSTIWGSYSSTIEPKRFAESGFDPDNPEIARLNHFVQAILNYPRHLSQHVGGFVLTEDRLDETVPIHNAAMADRTFIEWDKDDIDALGLMKVDVLALGMLTCIGKAFAMIGKLNDEAPPHRPAMERGVVRRTVEGPRCPNSPSVSRSGCHLPIVLRQAQDRWGGSDAPLTLQSIPDDDLAVWDMLCAGDSVGVFQVESRAQMNMLPRLRPREFYDLAIQVAIVRPGPIQGDMVHPYLRRRQGREAVDFPSPAPPHDPDELKEVLGKTLGVPLFQEQAMKLAIVAADFTPSEANQLRRAMATFRNLGTIDAFRGKMVGGMVERGYQAEFAERCFKQIEGFGSYGFPESHAIAFARLVWVSAWIKCHYPSVFAAALLNSQPMGFYAPAQIVRDAVQHGVPVQGPDVNLSGWDSGVMKPLPFRSWCVRGRSCPQQDLKHAGGMSDLGCTNWVGAGGITSRHVMECRLPTPNPSLGREGSQLTLTLGLRQIDGFREEWAIAIAAAQPFTSIEDLARRAQLPPRALRLLADADAFRSLGTDRREGAWEVRRTPADELPLFAAAKARELGEEADAALPAMQMGEHVAADYQTIRLSLKAHPLSVLRPAFACEGLLSCTQVAASKAGARVKMAGVVLVRQRPGNGKAIFITLEDEDAVTNVILWSRTFERFRREVMAARLMEVHGEVQRSPEGVIHLMAHRIVDRTAALMSIADAHQPLAPLARADEVTRPVPPRSMSHPRGVRTFPRSRDFH